METTALAQPDIHPRGNNVWPEINCALVRSLSQGLTTEPGRDPRFLISPVVSGGTTPFPVSDQQIKPGKLALSAACE